MLHSVADKEIITCFMFYLEHLLKTYKGLVKLHNMLCLIKKNFFITPFTITKIKQKLFLKNNILLFYITSFSPILLVFCTCPKLHELGDVVEEGEDHNDADVSPALTHTALIS